MMDITIRPVSSRDDELVEEITWLSETAFSRFGSYGELIRNLINEVATLAGALFVDSRFAGFVLLAFSTILPYEEDKHGPLYARLGVEPGDLREEIWAIALKPEWRGRRLADHLMAWAMDVGNVTGARVVHLTVAHDNMRAIRLFLRHGFRFEDCVDAGTYATGVRARYMYKVLDTEPSGGM